MTDTRAESSLSRIELVVLARLAKPKKPARPVSEDDLVKTVRELCLPDASPEQAQAETAAVVTALRQRGLVSGQSRVRTDDGAAALRTALGKSKVPSWQQALALFATPTLGFPSGAKPVPQAPLSRVELVVLARLAPPSSSSKAPPTSDHELAATVRELCGRDASPGPAAIDARAVVAALRKRGLVSTRSARRTQAGDLALRTALAVARVPAWQHVPALLAALALGFPAESEAARLVATEDALAAAVLCERLEIPDAATTESMCDALIAEALGMPPGTTLDQMRAHVLARRAERAGIAATGIDARREPADLAAHLAGIAVNACAAEESPLARALARRWVCEAAEPTCPDPADTPAHATPPAPASQAGDASRRPPPPPETVLEVVRETLPRVGADGRFGAENVFVSAIWHSIEGDRRLVDLSLDRFKRWLVNANRDGWLVLTRADLVGAMDPRQVAESEIEDRGATFHFVLDQQAEALASHRGSHAR